MSTGKLKGLLNSGPNPNLEYFEVLIRLSKEEVHDLHIILWHFINQTIQYQKYLLNAAPDASLADTDNDILLAENLMKRITLHDFGAGT